ncbi:MAG TPA: LytTR family DNA-binding domain-containing protein [Sunxiuqinia sp.]|nr:LytTR family DNA-binding domain-containing protein [Sunxiuqinia sp.]
MVSKNITAIIVDDDEEAMSLLEIYLKAFQEIEVMDKTVNPKQGIKLLIRKMPDIVFLDIDMPEINGLEVAEIIKENHLNTEIVFTTAHSKYAFKSLSVKPLDYLVKPFGPEELISVINRYKTKSKRKDLERRMDLFIRNTRNNQKIKLTTQSGIVFINPDEILMVQAETNYSYIYLTNNNTELITQNLQKIIDIIDSPSLVKANRSTYINLQYLRRIDKKNKKCVLNHQNIVIEEPINRSSLSFFEKLNCFPIS